MSLLTHHSSGRRKAAPLNSSLAFMTDLSHLEPTLVGVASEYSFDKLRHGWKQ